MKKFYDIHCHLIDFSHPGFLSFISNEEVISRRNVKQVMQQIPWYIKILPMWIGSVFPGVISRRLMSVLNDNEKFLHFKNLVSFMDNTIENQLLILDYFLRMDPRVIGEDNTFRVDNEVFNKIVLCPLIIDFGYKETNNPNIFYNKPSDKPVSHQVDDLFRAIRKYYSHKLVPSPDNPYRLKCLTDNTLKENKLFEVYPFLGINTRNYDLDEIERMFEKYFKNYESDSADLRLQKLFDMLDKYPSSVFQDEADFTYLFAGIKVYPPLGFDPWPKDSNELQKVCYVYQKCIEKKIPITTHCNDGGFTIDPHSSTFANPSTKWKEVLKHYGTLRLNFAHFGHQNSGKTVWQTEILKLMDKYENIYADISFHTVEPDYYKNFGNLIKRLNSRQLSRIMYGSDFMMVLSKTESFNHYLNAFINHTEIINKIDFCTINPSKFLFG